MEKHVLAGALALSLLLIGPSTSVGQSGLKIPELDTKAACRRPNSGDDCISKDGLAKLEVPSLWATAPEHRRRAYIIYVLLGPPHSYCDLRECLSGTADLSPTTAYLRKAQKRHYKYRFFYLSPDVAVPVETLGDCVRMQRRWNTGFCANGPQ